MAPSTKINLSDKVDDGEMDLSMCDLQEVPVKEIAAYRKVWNLDLSNNHLTQLSKAFPTLKNLTKLDLSKNKLKILPENFGDLINLKHLDLYKNELQHLPLSFGNLKNLKWLDLKDNPLVPAIQEAAGDCYDSAQCQICATNMIYFFTKLKEKVDEERDLREKQRQKEREKLNELNAQKKPLVQEKKKKKEPKQNQSYTKIKNISAGGEAVIKEPPKEISKPTKTKHSIWYYMSVSFIMFFSILFILTATGFEKTVIVEEVVTQTWENVVSNCHPTVQIAANLFAEYFLLVHNKVGDFLGQSEDRSCISSLVGKFQGLFG